MKTKNNNHEKILCPNCRQHYLKIWARGTDRRLYICSECSNDLNPQIFYQPTTRLLAVKAVKFGDLIDLTITQQNAQHGTEE